MADVSLNKIYNRLNGESGYHPVSANTYADWSMEAGDKVTISREGTNYKSPVGGYTLKWNGSQTIDVNTDGSEKRDAVSRMSAKNFSSGGGGSGGVRGFGRARQRETETKSEFETRFEQDEKVIGMSIGRVPYKTVEKYASKSKFPKTGKTGVLYHANDTGLDYVWIASSKSYHVAALNNGEANYVKIGEIALAFNEQTGQTEARLDADVVLAGKGPNGKLVTLKDLALPEWMSDTDYTFVTMKAAIGDLDARMIRAERITSKAITTDNFSALKTLVASGTFSTIDTEALYIRPVAGMGRLNVANGFNAASISQSGNSYVLTLVRFNGSTQKINFSRATTLSGKWSSRKFTVTAKPQGNKFYTTIVDHVLDLDFGSGYSGTGTLKATIGTSESLVTVGTIHVNARQAYENGADSVTPEQHTLHDDLYCSGVQSVDPGYSAYTFTVRAPDGRFSQGQTYTFWR